MFKKLNNKKGFTLMEMLIVVAIIAILVAIAIPTFTTALERAREATDMANIRAQYAELMVYYLGNDTSSKVGSSYVGSDISMQQRNDGWQTNSVNIAGMGESGSVSGNGKAHVEITDSGIASIVYGAN